MIRSDDSCVLIKGTKPQLMTELTMLFRQSIKDNIFTREEIEDALSMATKSVDELFEMILDVEKNPEIRDMFTKLRDLVNTD